MDAENTKTIRASDPAAEAVRRVVRRNMARWRRLALLETVGWIIALPLAYFWLALLADNLLHLGRAGRLMLAIGLLALAAYMVWTRLRRWWELNLSEDEVALAIERRAPESVQNRLINAIQLARETPGTDAAIGEAVIRENHRQLRQLKLPSALRPTTALVCIALAAAVVVAGLVFSSIQGTSFAASAKRILLPLAAIDPVYRTTLEVLPGDVKAAGDVTIRVRIQGEVPERITILRQQGRERASETIAVPSGADEVRYTFRNLRESLTYAVRGNDFTSPQYRITVDAQAELSVVKAALTFPDYTRWPERKVQSNSGDLEALIGTRAAAVFVLDRPAAEAALLLQETGSTNGATRLALQKRSDTEFAGELTFHDVAGYQLETRVADGTPRAGRLRALRVLADAEPKVELLGLNGETEVYADATLPLKVIVSDDIGLAKVGLFARRTTGSGENQAGAGANGWVELQVWPADYQTQFAQDVALAVASLGAVEGERYEIQPRAADVDPLKNGAWVAGSTRSLLVGGEGARLQLTYERILQTERDLGALIGAHEQVQSRAVEWMRQLAPESGLRWDDPKNIEALAAEMKEQAKAQEQLRQTAGRVARAMVSQAGDLRLSVGLLADTEMIRVIQIIEAVPGRDDPQAQRAALGDARLTQERIVRSLRDITAQYRLFREEWELANMIPFTKMLADRQQRMQVESAAHAEASGQRATALGDSGARRQMKVLELTGLADQAFRGMAQRTTEIEPVMSLAFATAATGLAANELKSAMQLAADLAKAQTWADASARQQTAAQTLADIHAALKKTQADLALAALAALQEKAKTSAEAQRELERLKAGTGENFIVPPEDFNPQDVLHMREVAKSAGSGQTNLPPFGIRQDGWKEEYRALLQRTDTGIRQRLDMMSLPKAPTPYGRSPGFADLAPNRVMAVTQKEYDDLMGKLLAEADIMEKQFDTLSMTIGGLVSDPGDVGKKGGDFSSTAAAAATGNQKPPPHNAGGVSRTGRQGARSFGMTLTDDSLNRRGRDEVQEGQERAPDQPGVIRERDSEDPQQDASTGLGGKRVQRDDPNSFNVSDAGKFSPEALDKMGAPREKAFIVERQDERAAPNIDQLLRDLNSTQEQVVERIKAIRKELKNLYLPTETLDELIDELTASMTRLTENPDPEAFRQQRQTLDKLRNTVRVFAAAQTGFQPSLPREQVVRGRVLDEAPRQTIPGYEDVVKTYYEMLAPLGSPARVEGTK